MNKNAHHVPAHAYVIDGILVVGTFVLMAAAYGGGFMGGVLAVSTVAIGAVHIWMKRHNVLA